MTNHTAEIAPEVLADYQALINGRGFTVLSGWSSVAITGQDRMTFLHSFCTNEVQRLGTGDSCEAFLLGVKGKILAHVLVMCRDEEIVLVTVPGQAPSIIEHLDHYVIREDVQLLDTSDDRIHVYIAGDQKRGPNDIARFACQWLRPLPGFVAEFDQGSDIAMELSITDAQRKACRFEAFEMARIEAGLAIYGIDFDAANLPQEVGRDREAISFTKGCYLGQETVARLDALGHVNKHLVGVRFAGCELQSPGIDLMSDDQVVGRATSIAFSPRLERPLGLAIVRRQFATPGQTLKSGGDSCQVLALPIVENGT